MIEAVDLSKRYADGTLALDALNLKVEAGEIYGLLGAKGSGKTTTLNLFLGFQTPTTGEALVDGIDVTRDPMLAKSRLAYLGESFNLYEDLSALHNLEFFARLGGRFDLEEEDYRMALREIGLPERAFEQKVHELNEGMRLKVGIAAAILKEAPAVLLDEPMAGLDPQAAAECVEILLKLRDSGRAILLATHDLVRAKQLADRVGILKEGRKVLTFSREELRYESLERLYLDYMRGGLETRLGPKGVAGSGAA